jgi:uncharacterized protein (DUF1697 family)
MAALRAALEQLQLKNVSTFIQSGNVLFESRPQNPLRLSSVIEGVLIKEFGVASLVIVVTGQQLERVVMHAPDTFGVWPAQYCYDVAFLKPPVAARSICSTIRLRDGVDQAVAANDVLYFQRLREKASQSHLSELVNHPAYKSMTIRNWKTTTELDRLIRSMPGVGGNPLASDR